LVTSTSTAQGSESEITSITNNEAEKKSKRSKLSEKLSLFSKKETPEEKEERLREKARKKELVEKYGRGDEIENMQYMRNMKGTGGARRSAVLLSRAAAGGAAG
jgi:hypothetical protein